MAAQWYVLTPAGLAGPYSTHAAARSSAEPYGWEVVKRDPDEPCTHAVNDPGCVHYS